MSYETIIVETSGTVGLITLNRPKALNALNGQLMRELGAALDGLRRRRCDRRDRRHRQRKGLRRRRRHQGDAALKSYMDVYLGDFITAQLGDASRASASR